MFATRRITTRKRIQGIWQVMKYRCLTPNCKAYERYGGRGITVCDEWLDYYNFERWAIANGYGDALTIDRIDNNKGYSPLNCQWLTRSEHASKTNGERINAGGRPKKDVPVELIHKLSKEGLGIGRIVKELKEQGQSISAMTISRELAGKRG